MMRVMKLVVRSVVALSLRLLVLAIPAGLMFVTGGGCRDDIQPLYRPGELVEHRLTGERMIVIRESFNFDKFLCARAVSTATVTGRGIFHDTVEQSNNTWYSAYELRPVYQLQRKSGVSGAVQRD